MIKKLSLYTFAFLAAVVLFNSCKKESQSVQMLDDGRLADYLAKNDIKAVPDPAKTGYFYVLTQPAVSDKPTYKLSDSVRYNLSGKSMLNGTVYWSSPLIRNMGMSAYYAGDAKESSGGFMGINVPAITEVLTQLKPGGSARIFLPSYLAFGKNGFPTANIPSNEIIELNISTYAEKQAVLDEQHIQAFITAKSLTNVIKDESGVHYIVTDAGTGTDPITINTDVKLKYTLRMLDGTTSDSGEFTTAPKSLVLGMEKILVKFKKGAKLRILIPSVLGYGNTFKSSGTGGGIPANSVLDFDAEIVDVTK
ncbi:FKBP-type peptidyl-prolyl cis-trans isomerase [Pedobacter caeni]|uniref:Peptidyl-prolyl cis-trans isomerase n=1 Tax=Pedobacter caeni TaxID=288992 RepID=A0A1M5NJ09_9SPHI|nr:FKBP-type peptidyl-prolyl cis-trans isomerase [Pedobacter caeni]SHG89546.1 FKBP-type peptidyl-prolyl cis-trans isomerase [Pedobacter caeni]